MRPANIDGAAGAVKQLAKIVEQVRRAWPAVRIIFVLSFGSGMSARAFPFSSLRISERSGTAGFV